MKINYIRNRWQSYDIYRDGLKIYTTIDSRVQKHAEKAVFDHLKSHQKKLFTVWKDWNAKDQRLVIEVKTHGHTRRPKIHRKKWVATRGLKRQIGSPVVIRIVDLN